MSPEENGRENGGAFMPSDALDRRPNAEAARPADAASAGQASQAGPRADAAPAAAQPLPPAARWQVAIINASTVCTDDEVERMVGPLQRQVTGDFAPLYGLDAELVFLGKGVAAPIGMRWITVLDTSDQAGALGYHDLTPAGLPIGKVFAASDKKFGSSISVTLSHEILEMLADPFINCCAQIGSDFYAYEVGDPVEADSLGYAIDGVQVSDFVTPPYFEDGTTQTKFDFLGHLQRQCPALMPGGYISRFSVSSKQWTQIQARHTRHDMIVGQAPIGSRRWRRNLPREEWRRSGEAVVDSAMGLGE